MILYKYKSTTNISYLSELLCGQILNCSLLNELNDPWEGQFVYGYSKTTKVGGIQEEKSKTETKSIYDFINDKKIRILSLSSDFRNRLLWSYYADSFKGICVEINFPDELVSDRIPKIGYINKVRYKGFYYYNGIRVNDKFEIYNEEPNEKMLMKILTNKTKDWKHENEYRLITYDNKYSIKGMINKIYMGDRADNNTINAIKMMAGSIPVCCLKIRNSWNNKSVHSTWEEIFI